MFYYLEKLEHVLYMHPGLLEITHGPREEKAVQGPDGKDGEKKVPDPTKAKKNDDTPGTRWKKLIKLKAFTELTGSFDPRLGYILDVIRVPLDGISLGKILPQSGFFEHTVSYDAVVQFPMEGEVIDAVVTKIHPQKIVFCFMGCIYGVIPFQNLYREDDFEYKEVVDIGGNDEAKRVPSFTSCREGVTPPKTIVVGNTIRLKIISRSFGKSGFWLVGSMDNKYLGLHPSPASSVNLCTKAKVKNTVDNIEVDQLAQAFLELETEGESK